MRNLRNIIDNYLSKKFKIILNFFSSEVYMCGGAIKDLLLGEKIKDLDFVVISNNDYEIKRFLKRYNLKFKRNKFNGYKIDYNGLKIDIWNTNNLYSCIEYNYDALFYNIKSKEFVEFGFLDCLENKKLTKVNQNNNLKEAEYKRKSKIKKKLIKLTKLYKQYNIK